jgi:hypothetical protein
MILLGGVHMSTINKCPRCKGWIIVNNDCYGLYLACLQCSYHRDIDKEAIIIKRGEKYLKITHPGSVER